MNFPAPLPPVSEPVRAAGPSTPDIDPGILIEEDIGESTDLDQPWHVVIFNDPVNLMAYVTMVIQRVFGYPKEKAEKMMLDVHHKGQCIVWTGPRESAEHYVQQLQSYQLLSAMKKAG